MIDKQDKKEEMKQKTAETTDQAKKADAVEKDASYKVTEKNAK